MKKQYFDYMLEIMRNNPLVYIIFADLGYPRVDGFLKEFPDRAFTVGASEQTALDLAVGLAYEGKIPFTYTITPFYWRAAETIRTYINHEKLNVKMVGAGRDKDYSIHDGFSHDACDIGDLMSTQMNIVQYYPDDEYMLKAHMDDMVREDGPRFLSLPR